MLQRIDAIYTIKASTGSILQLGRARGARDGALDETVGVRLGDVDGSVLAEVLDTLVPLHVCHKN